MASGADRCVVSGGMAKTVNAASPTSSPATPTRGIGRFGTPRTVFSPAAYSPAKSAFEKVPDLKLPAAACDAKTATNTSDCVSCCSSVRLKSVRPLLENLAKQMQASSSQDHSDADRLQKIKKVQITDSSDVKRPGIGRFGGKAAAAPVAPSAVVTPVAVVLVSPVVPVALTASTMTDTSVTPAAAAAVLVADAAAPPVNPVESANACSSNGLRVSGEASGSVPRSREEREASWKKLCEEIWAMDIEKTKAAMPDWIVAKYAKDVAKLARKNVPVASAAAASVAESAAPSLSPVKELVAPSVSPAAETVCQVQSESRSGKNELSSNGLIMCGEASGRVLRTHEEWQARFDKLSKEVRAMDIEKSKAAMPDWIVVKYADAVAKLTRTNVASASAAAAPAAAATVAESEAPSAAAGVTKSHAGASSVKGAAPSAPSARQGKTSSSHASGVERREGGGCGERAAGRAAGGRQAAVKAAGGRGGGRAVASGVCGREGVKQQAGKREGLAHERQVRPGWCSGRAHRRSS